MYGKYNLSETFTIFRVLSQLSRKNITNEIGHTDFAFQGLKVDSFSKLDKTQSDKNLHDDVENVVISRTCSPKFMCAMFDFSQNF